MPCVVVLKEKTVPFGKTLFMGGGAQLGVIQKNLVSLGPGVKKKMSQVRKILPSPHDFINERSLILPKRAGKDKMDHHMFRRKYLDAQGSWRS